MNWRKTFFWVSVVLACFEFLYLLENETPVSWLFIIIFVILAYILRKMNSQDAALTVLIEALGGSEKIATDYKIHQKDLLLKQLAEIEEEETKRNLK